MFDSSGGSVTLKSLPPPRESTAVREAHDLSALSNEELGSLWADTVRSFAMRRTGRSREFWRSLLSEPDVLALHAEFRRRAEERAEEYEAWLQWAESHPGTELGLGGELV